MNNIQRYRMTIPTKSKSNTKQYRIDHVYTLRKNSMKLNIFTKLFYVFMIVVSIAIYNKILIITNELSIMNLLLTNIKLSQENNRLKTFQEFK